jgi:hypothetical protein
VRFWELGVSGSRIETFQVVERCMVRTYMMNLTNLGIGAVKHGKIDKD